jgi:hypothetical protein
MMGHTGLVKLDKNYFKTHVLELAEEYLNAVPNLTISDEERAKAENCRLRKEKSELERKNEDLQKIRSELDETKRMVQILQQTRPKETPVVQ